ncbi:MAG: glycosyltransferase family 9 protein [Sediminibacterium sp.]|nr:glycosyltransferase family 9 protein [Sediminibacterium sp.]
MKFLVIRFSSIGDIVLATPAIRCLKQQVPNAEVHFLTKKSFKAVTEANPYIDKFFYYDDNLSELIGYLKKEGYHYIIDLHKNFRTAIIKWRLDVPALTFDKESRQKFLLTKFGINRMRGRHISDRCVDTLKPLGVVNDERGLDYFIPASSKISDSDLPMSHRAGYIAIVIGASYFTKKMPIAKLQQLCSAIQFPIILVGGKEDIVEGEAIAVVDPIRIYNACGKFSLNESADIIRLAKMVISHDTGLLYIACALGKKTIAIWGGTSPKLDVEPYYGKQQLSLLGDHPYQNFVVPNLSCQPCSNYGTKKCPKGHFKCMQEQDIEAIAETVLRL